jgi:putative flippase GtrA
LANRHWTFEAGSKNLAYHLVAFTLVSLFSGWIIQGVILSLLPDPITQLIHQLNWDRLFPIDQPGVLISKLLAISIGMIWNYLLYATLVFGKLGDSIADHFSKTNDGSNQLN